MANEKHIFIGIGGSGCQTVAQIKEKVYDKRFQEATATKTRLQAMNDDYRFLFIDTDQRDIDEANKRNRVSFEQGKVPFISPQTDLINLGRANPQAIYYEANQEPEPKTLINKRILEACSKEVASRIPDQPLAFGAGAFRMKSRIAFAHSLTDFQSKVQAAISALNDVKTVGGEDSIIYYWVIGSTLGGTGSGIFNDVLYHLNQIHHQVVGNGDPQLVLTMYMPKVYIDSNATEEKYTLNAFGVFTELDAFKAMSFSDKQNTVMHRLAFQNDYSLINSSKRYCPFYYLIPIDIQTDKGTSLGNTRTMYRNTAEMLYHLHYGKAGATFRSDLDNYMNDIMERNHKEFLVPMGYVSLQKPVELYNQYMNIRFTRDIMRSWLLADNDSAKIQESEVESLRNQLFKELNPDSAGSIAQRIAGGPTIKSLNDALESQDPSSEVLSGELDLSAIQSSIDAIKNNIGNESKMSEKRDEYKRVLVQGLWEAAEKLVRKKGLCYTLNAVKAVRDAELEKFNEIETKGLKSIDDKVKDIAGNLENLHEKAKDRSVKERTFGSNKDDINKYIAELTEYKQKTIDYAITAWAHDLMKDFCTDEKNDELSKLRDHLSALKDKAAEMTRDAENNYNKLANKMSDASLDVTSVYLPQMTTIADGNGWIQDNPFSKFYTTLIPASRDKDETPRREFLEGFLNDNIYLTSDKKINEEIAKNQYIVELTHTDEKTKKEVKTPDKRFFCNNELERSNETIIQHFLQMANAMFDKRLREHKELGSKWYTKKISAFFNDLSNEEKDNVRRSLNPALFFSYNANRIDVMKKEEHIVFVAGNEDLAMEMLGYQKGNPKHRFVPSNDEDTALVLKSKYGLSLEDYRIYDAIKMVYDKATFREKYHFHHVFAQFMDKITLDDMPEEILPQHRSFAKMLLLNEFHDETKDFFYTDEYDPEAYDNRMYIPPVDGDGTYFYIAQPEALKIHANGKIILYKELNGRPMYKEIEGADFVERFAKYKDLYHNYRFGETTKDLLQAILRRSVIRDGNTVTGEMILKENFDIKHKALLKKLSDNKKNSSKPAERKLWDALFNIVRYEFDRVHKFIKE